MRHFENCIGVFGMGLFADGLHEQPAQHFATTYPLLIGHCIDSLGDLGRQPDGDSLNVTFTRRSAYSLLVYTFLLPRHGFYVH
jgi:hypothetical protein